MKTKPAPFYYGFILLVIMCVAAGCQSDGLEKAAGPVIPEGTSTQPAISPEFQVARPSEGSLWTATKGSFFEDTKATHVGDTIIVDIVENTSSQMDVNTEAERKTGIDIGVPTINILGHETNLGGAGGTKLIGTDFKSTFEGEAKSDRSGQVTASIAARITEVLPNGNFSVFGRRAMKLNNEVQYILVSGVVRPEDISSDNRVQSTYLADARIEYYGKGALSDKQKPGWGTRIIDNVWPF
ncbi:MAG: flagellar basal body L-ring protein FlgH [Desulfobacteraceae bacterium]|nr:MAG: flagellar basal body L-ring protein FlgH [Desulfobacteraceae bacterium]